MYRNRLEKMSQIFKSKIISKLNGMGSLSRFIFICKKSNYREYIKKNRTLSNPHKKVLPEELSHKGTCERESSLFLSFKTWLYFFSYQIIVPYRSGRLYAPFNNLVVFFKKVVVK